MKRWLRVGSLASVIARCVALIGVELLLLRALPAAGVHV
jgi:hypothetical protein